MASVTTCTTSRARARVLLAGGASGVGGPVPGPVPLADALVPVLAVVAQTWTSLGSPAPATPWLPPLPRRLPLPPSPTRAGAVGAGGAHAGQDGAPVLVLGLVDEPEAQRRSPLRWDLGSRSHLLVVGAPRSGRTGAALAVLAAATTQTSPEQLVVHVVDPSGALAGAASSPGVASVVAGGDVEHAGRVLQHLVDVVAARRAAVRAGVGGQASPGGTAPSVLLVLDGWEAVQATWEEEGGACADLLQTVLRDGPGAGVLVLLTGDARLLGSRVGAAFGTRLVLRVADPVDAVLAGLPAREAPVDVPAGRGVLLVDRAGAEAATGATGAGTGATAVAVDGGALPGQDDGSSGPHEVQVALVEAPLPGPAVPLGALPAPGGTPSPRHRPAPRGTGTTGDPRRRVPALPERVATTGLEAPDDGLLLGVGGTDVRPLALRPDLDGPLCLLLGPPGSGRTTALATLERSGADRGWATVLVARPGTRAPRRPAAGPPGLRVDPAAPDAGTDLRRALALATSGADALALLVDDADLLEGTPLARAVAEVVAEVVAGLPHHDTGAPPAPATGRDVLVVVAATTAAALARSSGLLAAGRRSRGGVLLAPGGALDGEALGTRTARWPRSTPPGRGLLVRRGRPIVLQVAEPATAPASTLAPRPRGVDDGRRRGGPDGPLPRRAQEGPWHVPSTAPGDRGR